jgi:hypothetical protein
MRILGVRVKGRGTYGSKKVGSVSVSARQIEAGAKIGGVCRQLGVAEQTYFQWKKQYAGLGVSEARR